MVHRLTHFAKMGSEKREQFHQKRPDMATKIPTFEMNAIPVLVPEAGLWGPAYQSWENVD